MLTRNDMVTMAPVVLELNPDERDPKDWLHRMINLADTGTRIIYWRGKTNVLPQGRRKEVFEFMLGCSDNKRVRLFQQRDGHEIEYVAEVR